MGSGVVLGWLGSVVARKGVRIVLVFKGGVTYCGNHNYFFFCSVGVFFSFES